MLELEPYLESVARLPKSGRHILAQYEAQSVVVYQAFKPLIADYAVNHQRFGEGFSLTRMSWIKPGFLWMMYRSGWASKVGQERILAIRLARDGFEAILAAAVWSTFEPRVCGSESMWKRALRESPVRLQWDPDHGPTGSPHARRAIQLGLSGDFLHRYVADWTIAIEDVTAFVKQQQAFAGIKDRANLVVPKETLYVPCKEVAARLLLDE